MEDRWGQLWEIATSDSGGDAIITPDPESSDHVLLTYSDGSQGALYWHHDTRSWHFVENFCIAPCDVAARDSL
jgi:hypothetical protein